MMTLGLVYDVYGRFTTLADVGLGVVYGKTTLADVLWQMVVKVLPHPQSWQGTVCMMIKAPGGFSGKINYSKIMNNPRVVGFYTGHNKPLLYNNPMNNVI
jgi:hypothetical protein